MAPKNAKTKAGLEASTTLGTGQLHDVATDQSGNAGGTDADGAGSAPDAGATNEAKAPAMVDPASLNTEGGSTAMPAAPTPVASTEDPDSASASGSAATSSDAWETASETLSTDVALPAEAISRSNIGAILTRLHDAVWSGEHWIYFELVRLVELVGHGPAIAADENSTDTLKSEASSSGAGGIPASPASAILPPPFLGPDGKLRQFVSDEPLYTVRMGKNVKIDGVKLEHGQHYNVPADIWHRLSDLAAHWI